MYATGTTTADSSSTATSMSVSPLLPHSGAVASASAAAGTPASTAAAETAMPAAAAAIADFRSDTVTRPTAGLLAAMVGAAVGDDVFGDDPTVAALQTRVAALCGKEAALFVCTGVMSNQLALKCLVERRRGTAVFPAVLADHRAHVLGHECGGIAYHAGAQIQPVVPDTGCWHLTADAVERNIALDDDLHSSMTAVVSLEIPLGGQVLPFDELERIAAVAARRGVPMHLDGARLWNATVATGRSLADYCRPFETISLCLSKGMGAPVGSVLVGPRALIDRAIRYRKLMGGGWRQAGLLAAAGLYVIDNHWRRLADDHALAALAARELEALGFVVTNKPVDTNIVFFSSRPLGLDAAQIQQCLADDHRVRLLASSAHEMRIVTHMQVDRAAVDRLLAAMRKVVADAASSSPKA